MQSKKSTNTLTRIAQVLTWLLQPNILQLVSLSIIPIAVAWEYFLIVFILSFLLPIMLYILYTHLLASNKPGTTQQQITPFDLARRYRFPTFIFNIASLCVLYITLILPNTRFVSSGIDLIFLLSWIAYLIMVNVISMGITFFYKISLHVTASTALFSGFYWVLFWHDAVIILIGLSIVACIAWSRFYIKAHTWHELLSGFLLGMLSPFLFAWIKPYVLHFL